MSRDHGQVIRIVFDDKNHNYDNERYKEYHCYGRERSIDTLCGQCSLRFQCFTDRNEPIEIPLSSFKGVKSLRDVTARDLVKKIATPELKNDVVYTDELRHVKVPAEFGHIQVTVEDEE